MAKILIFGHSFVYQLGTYVRETYCKGHNFGLSDDDRVSLYRIGGMNVQSARHHTFVFDKFRPDIVILELGSKDVCNKLTRPENIGSEIHELACFVRDTYEVKEVVLSEVLFREKAPRGESTVEHYNNRVIALNKYLHVVTEDEDRVSFWRHRGLWCNIKPTLKDGIHLNDLGHKHMYRSMKGAMIRALRSIA